MPSSDDAMAPFERQLAKTAADFAEALRRHILPAPRAASPVAGGERGGDEDALRAVEAQLRRQAWRNDPRYDLNRHIAIRRLMARRGVEGA